MIRWVDRNGIRLGCAITMAVVTLACARTSADADPQLRRLVVLGDSLSVYPSTDQSFPAELQRRIDEDGLRWVVTNAGKSGDTTADGAARIGSIFAADVGAIVVALGANDGLRGVDLSSVEANLAEMIERAKRRGIRVLLCGMEAPPTRGWGYALAFRRVYPRVSKKYAVPLVPFLLGGVALAPEMNGADGVHPNAAGARQIAETIWPYLRLMLR
jgi:acyl-CoA thioesterase-1